jgi:hypothetical protein
MFFKGIMMNLSNKKSILTQGLKRWLAITSLLISIASSSLYAADNQAPFTLTITPKQCVSVEQGQDCYVDIELTWHAEQTNNYCVFSSAQKEPLQCWENSRQGTYSKEVVANSSVQFSLRVTQSTKILASEQLDMAWVYKKSARRNASWRMF